MIFPPKTVARLEKLPETPEVCLQATSECLRTRWLPAEASPTGLMPPNAPWCQLCELAPLDSCELCPLYVAFNGCGPKSPFHLWHHAHVDDEKRAMASRVVQELRDLETYYKEVLGESHGL